MDHKLAQQTKSADRYLLDELSGEERLAFEEHMFDCPECAAKVKDDFAMLTDLKEVLAEPVTALAPETKKPEGGWREWLRLLVWAPSFAALALACLTGYQNFVSIPAMLQPQLLDTSAFVSTTRGATMQTATIKPGVALFAASFEVVTPSPLDKSVCEFQAEGKGIVTTVDCGKHATSEFTLSLLLPSAQFPAGVYTMILRDASGAQTEVARFSFAVKHESR